MTDFSDDHGLSRRSFVSGAGVALAAGTAAAGASAASAAAPASRGRFAGKVAWITGGARGQGRSHAERLAAEGADVIISDSLTPVATLDYPLATQADLDHTADLVRAKGGRVLALKSDVRDPAQTADVVRRGLAAFGKIDLLVANAGIYAAGATETLGDALFNDILQTNLYGVFHSIRAVLPGMSERRYGRIVATASVAGRSGLANTAAYCASKWGVIGLVKSTALDVAKRNITVNAVCPTGVNTPLVSNPAAWARALPNDPAPTREKFEALMRANPYSPQGVPWVESSDVSDVVLFLLSEEARHTTGAAIDIAAGGMAGNAA